MNLLKVQPRESCTGAQSHALSQKRAGVAGSRVKRTFRQGPAYDGSCRINNVVVALIERLVIDPGLGWLLFLIDSKWVPPSSPLSCLHPCSLFDAGFDAADAPRVVRRAGGFKQHEPSVGCGGVRLARVRATERHCRMENLAISGLCGNQSRSVGPSNPAAWCLTRFGARCRQPVIPSSTGVILIGGLRDRYSACPGVEGRIFAPMGLA